MPENEDNAFKMGLESPMIDNDELQTTASLKAI